MKMFGPGSFRPKSSLQVGLEALPPGPRMLNVAFTNLGFDRNKYLATSWFQNFGFLEIDVHLVGILMEISSLHLLLHLFQHFATFSSLLSFLLRFLSCPSFQYVKSWCCDQCWQWAGLNCPSPNPAPWSERAPRSGGQLYSARPRGTLALGKKTWPELRDGRSSKVGRGCENSSLYYLMLLSHAYSLPLLWAR